MVLSVDEKPSIQAMERASGYVETDSGKVVRGLKCTYKRHGTLNLFAALEVGTGQVKTKFTEYKKREDFRGFLDDVLASPAQDKQIHVILDNYSPHKGNDAWLAKFFKTKDRLREAIEAFIRRHNERAKPFRWRKREVKGSQPQKYNRQIDAIHH